MSETIANDKNDSGSIVDCFSEPDNSSIQTLTNGSLEKLLEEELNSLSLIDCPLPIYDEHLSPVIQRNCCDMQNPSIDITENCLNCDTTCTPCGTYHDDCEATIGLFGSSDDWFSAEKPREEPCCDGQAFGEETWPKSFAEYPEGEYSQPLKTPQAESTGYHNSPSTSELLVSVVQSYKDALNDQKTILARQTDALNRLAAAIESQTKMIDMVHEMHRRPM